MPQKPQQKNSGLLDIEKILKILPHRYPFLLIDRVLKMEKGKSIVAIKNVTYNEHFFQGHFPQQKVMPGVLIIEALAQAGAILIFHSIPEPEKVLIFMSKVSDGKFRKPVFPGDQLRLEGEILKLRSKFCQMRGKVYVGEELVAEGEVMASLMNLEELNEQK
jgi:3-hydroxyacyl-[acyl-carrier-protein] dehydratase/UDP-3-O-[3-hydroxymyristoyl] N-acetylglucosamine deacetylase/3-hydroxyacyl-[acyl-carrier-protein] dehydratase